MSLQVQGGRRVEDNESLLRQEPGNKPAHNTLWPKNDNMEGKRKLK